MAAPWLEIKEVHSQPILAGPGASEYRWQAMFACLIEVPPHQEWSRLKWGWNVAALFDEAIERQKLFLELQHSIRSGQAVEPPDQRTLALRYIVRPGEELQLSVIAKVHARSEAQAMACGMSYYAELKSTFPYDYALVPAASKEEFLEMGGEDLLSHTNQVARLFQIKRGELPIQPSRNSPFLQGFWQSSARAHEAIWRVLAGSPPPLLLNISLRSTILIEKERERLLMVADQIDNHREGMINQRTLTALKQWNNEYLERRLHPWKKYFYLQVHLVSPPELAEILCRVIGSSITLSGPGVSVPGYKIVSPRNGNEQSWQNRLLNLEPIFSDSYLAISRLAEVADLEEVFAVMRLPYSPPDNGLPGVKFISSLNH